MVQNTIIKKIKKLVDRSSFKRFNSASFSGRIAQSVEQRIENPRVGSSILPPATTESTSCIQDFPHSNSLKNKYFINAS